MLYYADVDEPLGQKKAQELLAKRPRVLKYTRAWIDDSELCLEVKCELNDGRRVKFQMLYCWDQFGKGAFCHHVYTVLEWSLNQEWDQFYEFVQKRFDEVLEEHATRDSYQEYDEYYEDVE